MAERSRAYVYDCCVATKTTPRSNPITTYEKEILPSTKNTLTELSMGYRVYQLILCHNNILTGDWQSLRINSKMLKCVGAVRELDNE